VWKGFYRSFALWYSLEMHEYPVFLNLSGKKCLVLGAGGVGLRKIRTLLSSNVGMMDVIELYASDDLRKELLSDKRVTLLERNFSEDDLDNVFLVVAATNDHELNARVAELCIQRNILCNIADLPEKSSFIVPASVCRGPLTVCVSTDGKSPAMAKRVRRELEEHFGNEYEELLAIMGRIRPRLIAMNMETTEHTRIFRALVYSNLIEALEAKDVASIENILSENLPAELQGMIPELVNGL